MLVTHGLSKCHSTKLSKFTFGEDVRTLAERATVAQTQTHGNEVKCRGEHAVDGLLVIDALMQFCWLNGVIERHEKVKVFEGLRYPVESTRK